MKKNDEGEESGMRTRWTWKRDSRRGDGQRERKLISYLAHYSARLSRNSEIWRMV
jgi:hypothetical protein